MIGKIRRNQIGKIVEVQIEGFKTSQVGNFNSELAGNSITEKLKKTKTWKALLWTALCLQEMLPAGPS